MLLYPHLTDFRCQICLFHSVYVAAGRFGVFTKSRATLVQIAEVAARSEGQGKGTTHINAFHERFRLVATLL